MMKDEYEGLSDAERAALEDPEDELEQELIEDLADEEPESDAEEEVAETAADGKDENESQPEERPFAYVYTADEPTNYAEEVAALEQQKKDLRKQFSEGDLDLEAYEERRDAIEAQSAALRESKLKATLAQEQRQQLDAQRWLWEQERFFAQKSNRVYVDDPVLRAALNDTVKSLASDPANHNQSGMWHLEEADRRVRESIQRLYQPADAGKPKKAVASRNPPPPNIGDVPPADVSDVSDASAFAHIDRLTGIEREMALAKLSEDDVNRYLRLE